MAKCPLPFAEREQSESVTPQDACVAEGQESVMLARGVRNGEIRAIRLFRPQPVVFPASIPICHACEIVAN